MTISPSSLYNARMFDMRSVIDSQLAVQHNVPVVQQAWATKCYEERTKVLTSYVTQIAWAITRTLHAVFEFICIEY
jgi:hypothetical protein